MPDVLTKAQRSRCMAAIRSKNTMPEVALRRLVHRLGYRFRLHDRRLPGTPDIVLARHRKVIEVRGCFWHGHGCGRFRMPSTRQRYWVSKFKRNNERDRANLKLLRQAGWRVLVIWEYDATCEKTLAQTLLDFLTDTKRPAGLTKR